MNSPSLCNTEDSGQPGSDSSDSRASAEKSPPVRRKQKRAKAHAGSVSPDPVLPPCRICGEKASGFHYGANTCEACKAFFRRSLRKGAQYACAASGKCQILPGKRNSCPACRFQKCISIGMSKSAIKTGRYTHAKKARDILEVKGLKEQPVVSGLPVLNAVDHCTLERSAHLSVPERRPLSPVPSVDEMDEIIQRITAAHARISTWTPDNLAKRAESEKLYLEHKALQLEIFGPMQPITEEEYSRFYLTTGIDIDGRRDFLQSEFRYCEESFKRFIKFVKEIPSFSQLPINDQTTLVKASCFGFWMIVSKHAFNPDHKLYTSIAGRVISIEEFNTLNGAQHANEMLFELQGKLLKLGLNEEETCVLAAMCVMYSDEHGLEDVDQVVRCQSILRNCFLRLTDKYHSDDPLFIARVVAVLVEMRTLGELHKVLEGQFALRWAKLVDIPPLFYELMSSV